MTQVFLSHSIADADFALRLANDLRAAGIPVWKAPESIMQGEQWVPAIQRGMTSSTHFLLLQSPHAVTSRWVNFEFDTALSLYMQDKMRIIPLDYMNCDVPPFWGRFQHVENLLEDYYAALFKIQTLLRDQPANPPKPTSPDTTIHIAAKDIIEDAVDVTDNALIYRGQPAQPPAADLEYEPETVRIDLNILNDPINDILPAPFEWVDIPATKDFRMVTGVGDKGVFYIPAFKMAKYPLTYAQFQVFVDADDGYDNPNWWRGLAVAEAQHRKPAKQGWPIDNHPREYVSWYEAVAFCRWLSEQVEYSIRIPTEWEWQWAAAGDTNWDYPYGPEFDETKANTGPSEIGQTTPVDAYPEGASPFGVLDMSGNVWEMCLNHHKAVKSIGIDGTEDRVIRGGSWYDVDRYARVSYRLGLRPDYRDSNYGFRIMRPD